MKRTVALIVLAISLLANPAKAQETEIGITSPQPNQFVQGVVEVFGTNSIPGYKSSELAFAYTQNLPKRRKRRLGLLHPSQTSLCKVW